ncbi:MAG: TIM barrel protein [Planctomycetota bacterium]
MLLTLHAESLADKLKPEKGRPELSLLDLPAFVRETLDLHGLHMTTRVLQGATRKDLESLRDASDKARCACLVLADPDALEFAHESDSVGDAAVDRTLRVMQAGQFLGCSSISVAIDAPDNEDSFDFAIDRLKRVADTAERAEINVLLAPRPGLTAEPERITELIKKIGGFRIGTMPDFLDAAAQEDPDQYLRRVVPYASAVVASTLEFTESQGVSIADRGPDHEPDHGEEPETAATESESPPAEPPSPAAEDGDGRAEGDAGGADAGPSNAEAEGADALAELLEGVLGSVDDEEDEEDPPPTHEGFDIPPMVAALKSVGFDGTLAVRYRGAKQDTIGVDQGRRALEHAIRNA